MAPTQRHLNLGTIFLMLVPLGAALVHFLNFDLGSFRVSGWLWVLYLLVAVVLIQAERSFNVNSWGHFPVKAWMPWLCFLWLSLVWCDGLSQRNVQDAVQITMPIVIGLMAGMVARRREHLQHYLMAAFAAIVVLSVRVLLIRMHVIDDVEQTGSRLFSITAVFIASVAVALTKQRFLLGHTIWVICLLVTACTGSRMTTGAILMLPVLNPLNRNLVWRGTMLASALLVAVGLFYTPQFQQRFFQDGHGSIRDLVQGNFLSFGRFEAWPAIFEEAKRHPIVGAGVGEVVEFVPQVWPEEDKPHNDFLRLFFETGLLGLTLFWSTMFWQYHQLVRRALKSDGLLQIGFGAASLGIWGFAMLCLTDNVLIYNLYYNNLLFGLIGLCYGISANETTPAPAHQSKRLTSRLFSSPPPPAGHPLNGVPT